MLIMTGTRGVGVQLMITLILHSNENTNRLHPIMNLVSATRPSVRTTLDGSLQQGRVSALLVGLGLQEGA
jgi:hypothetical protein